MFKKSSKGAIKDWGEYVDENRKLLVALENLKNYITHVDKESDTQESWGSHMVGKLMDSLGESPADKEQMLQNLKNQSDSALQLLEGGGEEEEGLIPLVRQEVNDIENFLKKNSPLTPEAAEKLMQQANNFNSKKLRLWENLRTLLGNEESLGYELINYSYQTEEDFANEFINRFSQMGDVLTKDSSDETILMALLEVVKGMDNFRDNYYGVELKKHVNKKISKKPSGFKTDIKTFIENFLENYKQPVKERIEKVEKILQSKGGNLNQLTEEEYNQVMQTYNELVSYLFKGTSYESVFQEKSTENKLSQEEKLFQQYLSRLAEKLSNDYPAVYQEGMDEIVLMPSSNKKVKQLIKKISNILLESGITVSALREVEESTSEKKKLSELYKYINEYIEKVIENDSVYNEFVHLQPYSNPIGRVVKESEEKKLLENYWNEWGSSFENSAKIVENAIQNWNSFVYSILPYVGVDQRYLSVNFLHLIPALYDGSGENYQNLKDAYNNIQTEVQKSRGTLQNRRDEASKALETVNNSKNSIERVRQETNDKKKDIEGKISDLEKERRNVLDQLQTEKKEDIEKIDQQISELQNYIGDIEGRREEWSRSYPNPATFANNRGEINNQAYEEERKRISSEIKRLEKEISSTKKKITELRRQRTSKEKQELNSERLNNIDNKIEELESQKESLTGTVRIVQPVIDRGSGIVQDMNNTRDVSYEELDSVLGELEENSNILNYFVELFGNLLSAFEQYNEFIDAVVKILAMVYREKEKSFREYINKYKQFHEGEELTDSQVWSILNRGFKFTGGVIFQNS